MSTWDPFLEVLVSFEREEDGRWIAAAETPKLLGYICYGDTPGQAADELFGLIEPWRLLPDAQGTGADRAMKSLRQALIDGAMAARDRGPPPHLTILSPFLFRYSRLRLMGQTHYLALKRIQFEDSKEDSKEPKPRVSLGPCDWVSLL